MPLVLEAGESFLMEGPANHFKGLEAVGGVLALSDRALVFRSHSFNIQNHELSLPLSGMDSVRAVNTLMLVPNGLLVFMRDGSRERFVVWKRKDWLRKIEAARGTP